MVEWLYIIHLLWLQNDKNWVHKFYFMLDSHRLKYMDPYTPINIWLSAPQQDAPRPDAFGSHLA